MKHTPLLLIIMDGWGLAPPGVGNAISQAQLKTIPRLWNSYPHTTLKASGEAVGLPADEDGNTETGHINIGAGRIVYQDLVRIDRTIADGSFYKNDAFLSVVRHTNEQHSNIHLIGILSDAGVHASWKHLQALLEFFKNQNVPAVYLHLFTDGRDSPPNSALSFVKKAMAMKETFPMTHIATIMGRYYGMDRDKRWERTELAYQALTEGSQYTAKTPIEAVEYAYKRGETDEFIKPTVILDEAGVAKPRISDNDAVIFFNYRIDRPRQLTRAFVLPDFETHQADFAWDPYAVKYYKTHLLPNVPLTKPFTRQKICKNLLFITMTEYERNNPCIVAFPPQIIHKPIGSAIADADMRQLHASESEKERFVTYYFNCMREEKYPGEDRVIVPSPKVATYDLKPQMSAEELTDRVIDRMNLGLYQFIVMNFANADMVGHTGNIPAAIKACETVDACVGKLVSFMLPRGGTCVITADHGNVEEMLNNTGGIDTEHSTYPVPFIIINNEFTGKYTMLPTGKLGDIAPTILSLMEIPVPSEMTGTNLLEGMTG